MSETNELVSGSLPIRATQHVTEKQSRQRLEALVPDEWVIREVFPDYGVDCTVEIFSHGHPSGRTASVQIKGISRPKNDWVLSAPVKLSALNYLIQAKPQPAFLVFVNTGIQDSGEAGVAIARADYYAEIVVPNVTRPTSGNARLLLSIPICRDNYESEEYRVWAQMDRFRVPTLIGGNASPITVRGCVRVIEPPPMCVAYFTDFKSEDDFWRRETFANLGYLTATRPRISDSVAKYLQEQFTKENTAGQIGILEALSHVGQLPQPLVDVAFNWLKAPFLQQLLVAIHALGKCGESTVVPCLLNLWDAIPGLVSDVPRAAANLHSLFGAILFAVGSSIERQRPPSWEGIHFLVNILCAFWGSVQENRVAGTSLRRVLAKRPEVANRVLKDIQRHVKDRRLARIADAKAAVDYILDAYCYHSRR